MSEVTASLVKELREMTGAGMMDCKRALEECKGNIEAAVDSLRKKGLKSVAKRAGRVAAEGVIGCYSHVGDQVSAIVELNCETDFVARGEEFKALARGLAMHVAAMRPRFLAEADVPQEVLRREEDVIISQLTEQQKPNSSKIVPGKIGKFLSEIVLLHQQYVRDESGKTVQQMVDELSAKVGEKVTIRRFIRFEVGEGIEKPVHDLHADLGEQLSGLV